MKHTFLTFSLGVVLLSFSSCSDDKKHYDDVKEELPKGLQLVANTTFGTVLSDTKGRTLYFFANDADGSSNCNGQCEITWPAYYDADHTSNKDLNPEDIGVITRADGKKQSTYKGWPLYYYAPDNKVGDVKGDGVGGIWFAGKSDYTIMIANTQLIGADGNKYKDELTLGEGITPYFTNGSGRTLYAFTPDTFNKNTYTNEDFSNDAVWPIYKVEEIKSVPSVIKKDLFTVIDVFGRKQITYKGRPLYYFGQDAKRGETKGISVPRPGVWPIVNLKTSEAPR